MLKKLWVSLNHNKTEHAENPIKSRQQLKKNNNMKKFVSENWYKMMIGSSLLMASFGFMVHSVSPAMADSNNQKFNVNSNYKLVPTNADGSINVKLSNEQLDKIIPKNADGSINIMLTEKQLNKLTPAAIQSVNIQEVAGYLVSYQNGYDSDNGRTTGRLGVYNFGN